MDYLGLVQSIDGFGERIIVGVPHAAHRGFDTRLGQAFRVANRQILAPRITMMHDPGSTGARPQRLLQGIHDEGHVDEADPRRDVGKIGPQSSFGRVAWNCRLT